MTRSSLLPLLASCSLALACSPPPPPPGPNGGPRLPFVELTIAPARPRFRVGEAPAFDVRLRNVGTGTLHVPGALDGSSRGARLPHLVWTVEGPPDGWVAPALGYCGTLNPTRPEDVVALAPGEALDPYDPTRGFFDSPELDLGRFALPGRYVFTLRYSTDPSDAPRGSHRLPASVTRMTLLTRAEVEVVD